MGSEVPVGIDADGVTRWFAEHVPDLPPPLSFRLLAGGHSNLTYEVTGSDGRRLVLRRPPTGPLLASAHDMAREHTIISAVGSTPVPVPAAVGLCTDESVNGAPFYVMDFVDGVVLHNAATVEEHVPVAEREGLAASLIDVLADLHAVDPDAVGLGELGKKADYIPRQLRRWSRQWEAAKTRELPAMDQVHTYLAEHVPPQVGAAIVHGDYRLGNCLTGADSTIAAVLDWELCTLGDPMADVGYLMNNWAQPGEPNLGAEASPTMSGGFPDRDWMLERYAERSGRSVELVDYYRAFSHWRLAAIVEGVLARYLNGQMGEEADTDLFKAQVDALAGAAVAAIDRLDG